MCLLVLAQHLGLNGGFTEPPIQPMCKKYFLDDQLLSNNPPRARQDGPVRRQFRVDKRSEVTDSNCMQNIFCSNNPPRTPKAIARESGKTTFGYWTRVRKSLIQITHREHPRQDSPVALHWLLRASLPKRCQ